ncbi:MAG: glycosyltransferase family 1 protein [Patescibacteria group bacterium]
MRILIDARPLVDPRAGGVTRVARGLVAAFLSTPVIPANAGTPPSPTEVVLATTGSSKPDLSEFESGTVHHHHIKIPNKLWSLATMMGVESLSRTIEERIGKIDAVFLPNIGFVGQLTRPHVLVIHDLSFLIEPRWFSRRMQLWHDAVQAKRLIQNATHLLSVSETTKRDAIKLLGIPEGRISVIPMGPTLTVGAHGMCPVPSDLNEQNGGREPHAPTPKRYILALGWNDPRKNARTADHAVEILQRDPAFADLECITVGRDTARPTDEELASLYKHASAFLYPSWYEGYGFPLHEAASYGIPCIASTTGALPETAPPGTLFADPAKPHHWAEALRTVLTAPRGARPSQPNTSSWLPAAKTLNEAISRRH